MATTPTRPSLVV